MNVLYAGTSALVRAYLADEQGHDALRQQLLEGPDAVVTSVVTVVEFTSAVRAAERAGRLAAADELLARFARDCGESGPGVLIKLDADAVVALAHRLVDQHALPTLDGIHLAVAMVELPELTDELRFVTRDSAQGVAAEAEGLVLA